MTCLPFGLATAPCAFANVTNWLANLFRKEGIRIAVYLDDFLIMHTNPRVLQKQTAQVLNCLIRLGWCINWEKSILIPRKSLEYLGIVWNTDQNIKLLPDTKLNKVVKTIEKTLQSNWWTWKTAKIILGNLNFAAFVVPLGKLHCRTIQIEANRLPENDIHKKFHLPVNVTQELHWWLNHSHQPSAIHHKEPTVFITTDASDQGWGATINDMNLSGTWSNEQLSWHSNRKELWTLKETLRQSAAYHKSQTILAQTDNRSVAAYITKEGGTKSRTLLQLAKEILELAHRYQIHLVARYLPGRYNLTADSLSRFRANPEWTLSSEMVEIIFKKFGTPSIDLFASFRSAVVDQYVSEDAKDQACVFVNAFSRPWHYRLGWLFPPPSLIPRILHHLEKSSGTYLLVAPKWEKTFWKVELHRRALSPPFRIWKLRKHLVDIQTMKAPPAVEKLALQVWKIRAGPI
ncbi:uncharacterized protein LOC134661745 [Cydia amplana]|uniref:uncharacterized protein LOC134661745 n=1 Tax=Cydia amplana TaxID=1869771 RepID=UPI002FE598C8